MTHTKKLIISIVFLLVLTVASVLLARVDYGGICMNARWDCLDFFDTVAGVVFAWSIGISAFLFILAFLKKEVFINWFKFARIYIPLSILFIVLDSSNGDGNSLGIESGEFYGSLLSLIYFIVSIILIVRAYRRLKRQEKAGSLASGR